MDAVVITFPNILTLSRILAVPFFAVTLRCGHVSIACIIFFIAGLTDILDGYLARRFGQMSKLGALLDPIADKFLTTTAFIVLALTSDPWAARIPMWIIVMAVVRDIAIILTGIATYSSLDTNRFKPSTLGKLTTFIELTTISISLLANARPSYTWCQLLTPCLTPWLYYLMAAMLLTSSVHYFFRRTTNNI